MQKIKRSTTWKSLGSRAAIALLFFILGNSFPVSAAENIQPSAVEPQLPPPQGILTVYSERYAIEDEGTPILHSRPVEVYNEQGRFVIAQCSNNTGASRFDLSPGHYIVTSASNNLLTKVRVDIKDGEETVVSESPIEKIALNPSSPYSAASVHLDPRFCPDPRGNE